MITWMAERTAEVTELHGKGRIAAGYSADFAIFAPDQSYTVDAASLLHRNTVTPHPDELSTESSDPLISGASVSSLAATPGENSSPTESSHARLHRVPHLASRDLAGSVISANDELFARGSK